MQRLTAVLLTLLVALLALPSLAAAQQPGGGRGPWGGGPSATDTTAGAGASDDATADDGWDDGAGQADGADWNDDDGTATDDGSTDDGAVPAPVTTVPVPAIDPALLVPVPSSRKTIKGKVARIRTDGRAAIPRSAPKAVKRVIAAANLIIGKPYKWGGGHARLKDSGYDCSGAVSYALIRAGLQQGSMVSGTFARWAAAGAGRWISIHANAGHVYMEVAGLRLDTSAVGDQAGRSGVRWRPVIGRRTGFHTRHIVGL